MAAFTGRITKIPDMKLRPVKNGKATVGHSLHFVVTIEDNGDNSEEIAEALAGVVGAQVNVSITLAQQELGG